MNFFLKILNESRSRARLKVNGYSNARFIFDWDAKLRAYKYLPQDQDEVDDLFRTMGRSTSYIFAPVSIPAGLMPEKDANAVNPGEELAKIEAEQPSVILQVTPKEPLNDLLVEESLLRGVLVTDDDSNETARRLVEAYDKGAKDSLNSLPAVKKKPRQPAAAKAPKAPKTVEPPVLTPS